MRVKITPPRPGTSRIAHFLFAILLALSCSALATAQISPGRLSHAHQQFEGVSKCVFCHQFVAGARGFKCLECHAEIRRRVAEHTGFHARNYKSAPGEKDCTRCHAEHKGEGSLIHLDRRSFDHAAQTGLLLEGKHRVQKCENCHNPKKISPSLRPEIKQDLSRSFLGLRRACGGCHEEPHGGQLGTECTRCHVQESWKPAPGFDHGRTAFPLTGQHLTVPCRKCHGPAPGRETIRFKGLASNGCPGCHTDPHHGAFQEVKFRGTCDTCHRTTGWKTNHPGTNFNHDATKFHLVGKHAQTECFKCHKSYDFHRPVAHERCRDCHEDPHRGQFATRAAGSDCSACHEPSHFKPPRFDREMHRQAAFPLEGKHASLPCARCHQPEGRGAVYITRKLTCPACHADQHRGEFASAPHNNQCDHCHTTAGFKPTTFSLARHSETQFPLTGKHASVDCARCHKPLTPAAAPAPTSAPLPPSLPAVALALRAPAPPPAPADKVVVAASGPPRQFHFVSRTCNTCHTDPHQTRLACETCHTPQQWQEVRPFNHPTAHFKIEGSHQRVKCVQCHKPSGVGGIDAAKVAPGFSNTPTQCAGCHRANDFHGGQFSSGSRVEDCSTCHVPVQWKMGDFDHDRMSFVLGRAHREVPCAKCHKEQREVEGKMVRIYRDTPKECIKCHS